MCGRYTRKEDLARLAEVLKVILPHLKPSYNIAPSQMVAAVRVKPESGDRECVELKWGLIPSWAKDPSIGNKMINARGETVAEKPAFRKAFRQRRCLVLADGFYEWKREGKAKQPYYIYLKDNQPFAFAGLWERWEDGKDQTIESCALITTGSNAIMEPIHHRMPVILDPNSYDVWLDPAVQDVNTLNELLRPYTANEMVSYPVSIMVNNPRNDSPRCIEPASSSEFSGGYMGYHDAK